MIRKTFHFNKEVIQLESDSLIVNILMDFGMKITSIYDKKKEFEFVFQASDKKFTNPIHGEDFSNHNRCGIDDCIPTIDPCKYLNTDILLPDHGDVWSQVWDIKVEDGKVIGEVKLASLPLKLRRIISLNDNLINIDYELKNLSHEDVSYLWVFHGLNNFNENTILEFPEELKNIINVQNDDEIKDYKNLGNLENNSTYKFYFTDKIQNGKASLIYKDKNLKYSLLFDPKDNPYLGVWITTGGYMNERNIGIEPCNGYYDSLEKAVSNNLYKTVKKDTSDNWNIKILIEEI